MGLVKRHIENLTYAILQGCGMEDTDKNYTTVFQWVMKQDFSHKTRDEIISLFQSTHPGNGKGELNMSGNKHYIIHVVGSIEPQLRGPYKTSQSRDLAARRLRQAKDEEDGFFSLDIDKSGKPSIDSYSNGFMEGLPGFTR